MLEEVIARLKDKDMQLQQTRRFKDKVVAEGYDPSYEARLLRSKAVEEGDNEASRGLFGRED